MATLGLGGLLAAGLALPAVAAPAPPGDTPTRPPATFNNITEGTTPFSLTVTKLQGPPPAEPAHDGTPIDNPDHLRIAGVEFTLQRVESCDIEGNSRQVAIDLYTSAGWVTAQDVIDDPDWVAEFCKFDSETETRVTTNPSGVAYFGNLGRGLYLVTETAGPTGVSGTEDFLVTLPMVHPNGTWIDHVFAYPKNLTDEPEGTKSVAWGQAVRGEEVVWTVAFGVPAHELTSYIIRDVIDSRLTLDPNPVRNVTLAGADLTLAADSIVVSGNTITINFPEEALIQAASTNIGDDLVQVSFEIHTVANTDGIIPNVAELWVNETDLTTTPTVRTPEVAVCYASLDIFKHAAGAPLVRLPGAQFAVWNNSADAENNNVASRLAVFPQDDGTWGTIGTTTTGESMIISLACDPELGENFGLGRELFFREITPPPGFEADSVAQPFRVNVASSTPDDITRNDVIVTRVSIENLPTIPGFELPFTGGQAAAGVVFLGLLILGLGAIAARKKKVTA